jgi:hypothetical protein
MCWYIEWGKLTSDLNTVQMAHWFCEGLLQLHGTVIYFKNLVCLMLKIWDSVVNTVMRLQAG